MLFKKKPAELPMDYTGGQPEADTIHTGDHFVEDSDKAEESGTEKAASEAPEEIADAAGVNKMYESDLVASISRNTIILGDITTGDNLDVFGEVRGSVTSESVVKVYGTVTGDVTCATLVANNAQITGNIVCACSSVIGENTAVKGNIRTLTASISGKVTGDIIAGESVAITQHAVVIGDITTPLIEVSRGAVVYGTVVMDQPPVEIVLEKVVPPAEKEKPAAKETPAPEKASERPKDDSAPAQEDTLAYTEVPGSKPAFEGKPAQDSTVKH